MSRRSAAVFVVASLAALALFLPAALGANGGGGKGKGGGGGGAASQSSTTSGCTPSAPQVLVQNSYGWNQSGSWGRRGDTLGYQIQIIDQDSGCASSSFVLSVSAPFFFYGNGPNRDLHLMPARRSRSTGHG